MGACAAQAGPGRSSSLHAACGMSPNGVAPELARSGPVAEVVPHRGGELVRVDTWSLDMMYVPRAESLARAIGMHSVSLWALSVHHPWWDDGRLGPSAGIGHRFSGHALARRRRGSCACTRQLHLLSTIARTPLLALKYLGSFSDPVHAVACRSVLLLCLQLPYRRQLYLFSYRGVCAPLSAPRQRRRGHFFLCYFCRQWSTGYCLPSRRGQRP